MSHTAKLFYAEGSKSETLHRRITPSPEQFASQMARWKDLASYLIERLCIDSGYQIKTWLQGSYKYRTQIRPWDCNAEFDIDLGVYFVWNGTPQDGTYKPGELKSLVQSALFDYQADSNNDATEVTNEKERCCRIRFDQDFHIDVACYHLDDLRDARALATQTKGWEESDPKAIFKWFTSCQKDAPRKRLRRLIRYMKMWAALKTSGEGRPSSILLTVLTAEAFEKIEIDSLSGDDDMLEQVAECIADRLSENPIVLNPVNSEEDINRLDKRSVDDLVLKLRDLVDVGWRARNSEGITSAAEIWSEAFDQFFPLPEDTEEGTSRLAESQSSTSYSFAPDVFVKAISRRNKDVKPITGLNGLKQIPKDCDVKFEITQPELLPRGATIRWTVRNHGKEAVLQNDLGHVAGFGPSVMRHSRYNGDHSMDLTVFLQGFPIGRRRIAVKVRGPAIPPRNPPRRIYGR